MKIVKVTKKEELDSFGNYGMDSYFDHYLWSFASKVKSLSVENNDPYFSEMFLAKCLGEMEKFLEKRGPRI